MEKEIKDKALYFIGLNRVYKGEVQEMIKFIRENFDPKFNVCTSCAAQIKFAQRQIQNWLNLMAIKQETNIPVVEEIETSSKPPCTKCKKKTKNM